ncbi:MAG: methyltransferase [Oscillospiraceae bacterium]|nr:methyltransferase [Oscillospiraceae bacterium]
MINTTINNIDLVFNTDSTLFSPESIDKGTLAMLSIVELLPTDKVLDLGCGYGIVGIYAAKCIGEKSVVMSDVEIKCVEISRENAEANGVGGIQTVLSDGVSEIKDNDFTLILSNPPYHTEFSIPKRFIEKGFNRLKVGGKMYMVTKRKDWYKKKLISIFGGVKIHEIDGYFVFYAEKRDSQYANSTKR